ncbi:DUF2955 domain-containing protein [Gilvimarinus algae]|uniref:DUF2955 domain-containing protein n=1 Tax=Gilvimarinus algae TaxID=3058037 RepID=A0ABT8THW5_9GAMM|nr:DUF2955 domain-containing protein [Gilvimarinus sp. SDUM040014]MDO3383673.1 DUF2955 domain-containing protein [Gilvimarinus sp. SDUM040014]
MILTRTAQRFARPRLPLAARRAYRLAISTSLVLAMAYGLGLAIPFVAPLFVVILSAKPAPPPGPKQLLLLLAVVMVSLGVGVFLGPLLQGAPLPALAIIIAGLYLSSRLALQPGKAAVGTLLALGVTVIAAASSISPTLASMLISTLVVGIALAVLGQWLVYPFFPEDPAPKMTAPESGAVVDAHWLCWRATAIVLPAFLLTLTNPAAYLPLTVKSILLGREASQLSLREASREMIGSTLLGGCCAIVVWSLLSLAVNLWFYFSWMLLMCLLLASAMYGAWRTGLKPSFWMATMTTMIILLGAAVQDSANGKDVYQAFLVRMALFLAVAVYAGAAMAMLEYWRARKIQHLRNSGR